jgi:dTDP-4-dehydrorhamnose reductase
MRTLLTGATGFVGSNIAKVLIDRHGDTVIDTRIDMTDRSAVLEHVAAVRPDAVVHCAILNDWERMHADRQAAWNAYVEATRNYADAAALIGVPFCLVSTDWVFDGTQGGATEDTPPNPINLYGFLKAASEIVTLERGGAVARVMGVNGTHWARPATLRAQDPGFGYFVASLVDSLERGVPFVVWEGDDINGVASPSLGAMCGEVIRHIVAGGHAGIFHCCGSTSTTRVPLRTHPRRNRPHVTPHAIRARRSASRYLAIFERSSTAASTPISLHEARSMPYRCEKEAATATNSFSSSTHACMSASKFAVSWRSVMVSRY